MKVDRILSILCLLIEGPKSTEEIIHDLSELRSMDWKNFSKRTIWRDIKQLRSNGFRIDCNRRTGKYELKNAPVCLQLEPSELVGMAIACRAISEEAGLPYAKELAGALRKISSLLSPKSKKVLTLDPHFDYKLNPAVNYAPHQETIEKLRLAISQRRRVSMVYQSAHSGKRERRTVDPLELYFSEGGVRLRAHCHSREELREFRVDRIKELDMLPSLIDRADGVEPFEFKLRLDPLLTRSVGECFDDQKITGNEDGSSILVAKSTDPFRVILRVLSYGQRAEILSPDFLRNEMASIVREMAAIYGVDPEKTTPRTIQKRNKEAGSVGERGRPVGVL